MKKLMRYMRPYLGRAAFGMTIKSLGTVSELLLPLIMAYIIDDCLPVGNTSGILRYGGLMLAIALITVALNVVANCLGSNVSQQFGRDLRNDVFDKVQTLSLGQIDRIGTPSLITRLSGDVNNIQTMILAMLRIAIRAPILFIGGIIMALLLDWVLTLVLLALSPAFVAIIYFSSKITVPLYRKLQGAIDRLTLILRENLDGIKVIRSLSTESTESGRFTEYSEQVRDIDISAGRVISAINPAMTLLMDIGLAACIFLGGMRINAGGMRPGAIIAFINYYSMILGALLTITRIFTNYTRAAASAVRVNELLDTQNDMSIEELPSTVAVSSPVPLCEFRNVTFTYPTASSPTLRNLSFTLPEGGSLAVIGGTGSGKSTIVALLIRLYDAEAGKILVRGRDIRSYDLHELREMFAVVFQQAMLFSGDISANLRWGDRNASDERLRIAAQTAMADSFIQEMPDRYASPVLQGGRNFSGGQRQRLSIARAIVKDAPVLVMDDSASALDYITERKLRQNIKENCTGQSLIIIAQRISSVKDCETILVLDGGRMAGIGSHAELMEGCALYREIYESQV